MKSRTIQDTVVFVGLVTAGVALRCYFAHLPNFAPVAALALFAGFYFQRASIAVLVPLSVMLISDYRLGGYEPALMAAVYLMLAAPVALRGVARRQLTRLPDRWRAWLKAAASLTACALVSSLAFFAVTNLAVWTFGTLYEHTWSGLVRCYVQALPFFRYTLAGDMAFATVLFGGYAMAVSAAREAVRAPSRADVTA